MKIGKVELAKIQDIGRRVWIESQSFEGLSQLDVQAYLILTGLREILESRGFEPQFSLEVDTRRNKKNYEASEA